MVKIIPNVPIFKPTIKIKKGHAQSILLSIEIEQVAYMNLQLSILSLQISQLIVLPLHYQINKTKWRWGFTNTTVYLQIHKNHMKQVYEMSGT